NRPGDSQASPPLSFSRLTHSCALACNLLSCEAGYPGGLSRPAAPYYRGLTIQSLIHLEDSMSKSIQLIKEHDVKWVDLRFTDTKGKQHHVTMPARDALDEDFF